MALLEIKNLVAGFETPQGFMRAVDGVDITLDEGEVVGLVGESGCGKSTVAFSILQLLPHPTGQIVGGEILFNNMGALPPPAHMSSLSEIPVSDHTSNSLHTTHPLPPPAGRGLYLKDLRPHTPDQEGSYAGTQLEEGDTNRHYVNLLALDEKALCAIRGREISMIFQEPMSALNPVMRIGDQVAESLILHDKVGKKEAAQAVRKMLLRVGLSEEKAQGRSYPHELSGGERQRVMIAMALICKPKLIIADEPTTALDASLQTQILELLSSLQKETGVSVLFITHDLGLVKRFCQKVYVMYAGVVVETGRTRDIFEFPRHPYTRALLDSRPGDNILPKTPLRSIEGRLPTFWEWESGCRFAPRCPFAKSVCKKPQELLPTHTTHARCCRWSEIAAADGARAEEKPLLPTCFCFLVRKKAGKITDICLGFKKRGFAEGKWLSLGGKISAGETADQAVRREALEEAGVTLDKIHAAGTLTFKFMNNDGWSHRASVYLCDDWTGEIRESEEIIPRWYPVDQIPYHEMWPDNKIWLPLLLKGKTVNGNLVYSDEQTLVEHQVESGEWL